MEKEIYSNNTKGTIGTSYWKSFLKQNRHQLVSKHGQKYELSRHNWTIYANFVRMYSHIYEEIVCAEAVEPLPTPIWMDSDGNECQESNALGCQVTHRLCHPELCFVGNKVGGNISMKGDGHVGGQKLCIEQGTIPYKKASHTDKIFTMIGLTSLDGNPVMCVLIIQGKDPNLSVETGIDVTINLMKILRIMTSSSTIMEKGNISLEDWSVHTVAKRFQL